MGGEEGIEGEVDENTGDAQQQIDTTQGKQLGKPPRKPVNFTPGDTAQGDEDDEPSMVDPRA